MAEEMIEIPSMINPRREDGQFKVDIQMVSFKKAQPGDTGEKQVIQWYTDLRNDGPRIFQTLATITLIGGKVLDVQYREEETPQCP